MNSSPEPQLAPPGAGLPSVELFIARSLFKLRRWTGNRNSFSKSFSRERDTIRGLVNSCSAESAAMRVLIKRPPGLEDSSRYWSVWMTLDHLRIMNGGLAKTIGMLAKEMVPPGKANTATVKPNPAVPGSVVAEYEAACDALLTTATAAPNLKTKARFTHPWFGPLDASGWFAMAGTHMAIHRVQIQRIIRALPGPRLT